MLPNNHTDNKVIYFIIVDCTDLKILNLYPQRIKDPKENSVSVFWNWKIKMNEIRMMK